MQAIDTALHSFALQQWKPPPRLTLSEWADTYAVLSAESAAEAGKWKTLPYQRGVMDAFTDPTVEMVVWMKSARVGATKIFNHLCAYHMHQDPCPILVCQPTVEDAEGFSKDEIAPMIRDTAVLRNLVSEPKAKDGSNTILAKQFPGGTLQMVGANSARGFRRVSRRVVLFDEVDGYPASTPEGDQIKLGIKRSEYYWNRKIGIASTPTTKGFSRVERWFELSDQRRYFVPCPDCGHMQLLRWQQMKWEKDRPETVAYECEACQAKIPHRMKRWMVDRGEWRPTATAKQPGIVGFHIWAGYSYSPNATWEQLVREFLEVKSDPDQLRTFINTTLGETFEQDYANKLSAEGLLARREEYQPGQCPSGVLLLTAGVDTQDDRLECSIWGWGAGEEAWLIWHQVLHGDPSLPEVWSQLDHLLQAEWDHADGGSLRVRQVAVDTGGSHTQSVYMYARERAKEGVVGIKGSSRRDQPIINKGSPADINWKGQTLKRSVRLYQVGTDTAKTTLYGRLRHNVKGPGYLHFHEAADEEYFAQLTAEKQQLRTVKGFTVKEWVKKSGDRNEALDCLVYAYAALQLLLRRYDRRTVWEQLQKQLEGSRRQQEKPQAPAQQAAPAPQPTPIPARRRPTSQRRSGFVTGW
jgi:phage terminase large subunit GpA-like protein